MLGDDLAWDLGRLRGEALSLMCDTCTVERAVPGGSFDEGTGQYVDTWSPVYSGVCRILTAANMEANPTTSGVEFTVQRVVVQLPIDGGAAAVRIGDRVTVTASAFDPEWLVGRSYTITSDQSASHAVVRRFPCEEVR